MQDELISRQAAIDALKQAYWNKDMQNAKDDPCIVDAMTDWAIRTIKDLPPVNPQPKWIPVSERLPEEGESVLTQAMFKDDMKMCVSSRIDWNYWTGWGTRNINIIAWMPLPEPYKAESEVSE